MTTYSDLNNDLWPHVGQTDFTLELETGKVPADIKTQKIKYIKPGSDPDSPGEWTTNVQVATDGALQLSTWQTSDLDTAGRWIVWPEGTNQQDELWIGDAKVMIVKKPGSVK